MIKYENIKFIGFKGLAEIPQHWNIGRIKDVCSVKGRIGFRGYTKGDFVEKNEGGLVIGATEMTDRGTVEIKNPQFLSWEKYYESPEIILKLNDIVLVQRGSTVGKVAIIGTNCENATINPSLVILKKIKSNNQFLLYYLMSPFIQGYISAQTATTAIPMISQEQIGNYEIVIPPLTEQTQIANYLDTKTQAIDKKINLLTTKIEYYKELRKAIINEMVSGKLLIVNGKLVEPAETKESGIEWIGKIPKHWQVKRFKDVVKEFVGGGTPNTSQIEYWAQDEKDGYLWVSIADITNASVITQTKQYITEKGLKDCSTKVIKPFTILYSIYASLGKVSYSTKYVTTNQAILAIYENERILNKSYFIFYLKMLEMHIASFGNSNTQNNISLNILRRIEIAFPPTLKEQTEIATYLDAKTSTIDKITTNLQTQIETLKELRKTLINDVVTGKVKVIA